MKNKLKIVLAQLNPVVGDVKGNAQKLINIRSNLNNNIDIIVVPELYISGYPIDDLVLRDDFLELVGHQLNELAKLTNDGKAAIIIGAPRKEKDTIRNSVFVLDEGEIIAFRDKHNLPNSGVFDEQRIFSQGPLSGPVKVRDVLIGLPICEDIWTETVVECLCETGADIILSINASPYTIKKRDQRMSVAVSRVLESKLPLIYLNRVGGQDELVFDGSSFCLSYDGSLTCQLHDFKEETSEITIEKKDNNWVFKAEINNVSSNLEGLYKALVMGVRDYVNNNNFPGVVLGMSGGIDSALVAAIATDALGPELVKAIMMPSPYTSNDSLEDAKNASSKLGIEYSDLDIKDGMRVIENILQDFKGPFVKSGIAEENIQSRLRGLVLMAISNKYGPMVLATGNKSEYAVGYATLYGDMCGGFAVIKDLWKTHVFALCKWRNLNKPEDFLGPDGIVIPERIITKPPSAELRDDQKDTDSLPEYDILDAILQKLVEDDFSVNQIISEGFNAEEVKRVSMLLSRSEYKRFQSAPGPKVTEKAFGRDRRYPLTSGFRNWS
ncbi:NAD+ synthase [Alphaproteobacteria bacterium]|jgi:NAD+ synthase|nr:NAD+ synthase [Alphaproteobacteria bacterium]MDB9872024.1 NAD+ synthase [Alphaproteobacteria bacterium]|tara:strand:- start:4424 stop:6082 length:1659 start_codon:yes stop_codon:yes gene_type:complete